METEHLREYITLSQSLNYAKAAEALFVSQPALRSHVKALEDEVGSPLIVKRDGRLELSMAGRLFLKLARDIVSLSDDALASCKRFAFRRRACLLPRARRELHDAPRQHDGLCPV